MKSTKVVDRSVLRVETSWLSFYKYSIMVVPKFELKRQFFLIFESKVGFSVPFLLPENPKFEYGLHFLYSPWSNCIGYQFSWNLKILFWTKKEHFIYSLTAIRSKFWKMSFIFNSPWSKCIGYNFTCNLMYHIFSIFEPKGDVLIPFVIHKGFKIWTLYLNWPCSK